MNPIDDVIKCVLLRTWIVALCCSITFSASAQEPTEVSPRSDEDLALEPLPKNQDEHSTPQQEEPATADNTTSATQSSSKPAASDQPAPSESSEPEAQPEKTTSDSPTSAPACPPPREENWVRVGAFSAAAMSLAFLGSGAVFGFKALSRHDEARDATDPVLRGQLNREGDDAKRSANLFYFAALTAAVTSGALFMWDANRPNETVAVSFIPPQASVMVRW